MGTETTVCGQDQPVVNKASYEQHRRQELEQMWREQRNRYAAPADIGGGFLSFWMRDQQAQEWAGQYQRNPQVRAEGTFEPCSRSHPCPRCAEVMRMAEQATPRFVPDFDRGDVVEIDKSDDPNHQRAGPIWKVADHALAPYEVWFEDGIRPYQRDQLVDQEYNQPVDGLPDIRPAGYQAPLVAPDPVVKTIVTKSPLLPGYRQHPKEVR